MSSKTSNSSNHKKKSPNNCLTCKSPKKKQANNTRKTANNTKKRANWKTNRGSKTIFPNDQVPDLKNIRLFHPSNANEHVKIDLGKKFANRYVLFYAAKKRHVRNCDVISTMEEAYNSFKNKGVSKTNKEGIATLKLKCPQVYSSKGKVYFSHVHYIVADDRNKKWINELKTQQVVCQVRNEDLFEILDSGCAIILNAMPIEDYLKDRIPSSHPLPHELVLNKLSANDTIQYIKSCLNQCNKLRKLVESQKMDILNVPIVTYCIGHTCNADNDLQEKLNKIGFTNVKVYGPGLRGFRKSFGPG